MLPSQATQSAVTVLVVSLTKHGAEAMVFQSMLSAGVGHCPMDEAPDLINPAIMKFVNRHATNFKQA